MNRITRKFEELKTINRKAFIGYLTAGDPNIEKTEELVYALEAGGSDIIEIGIPYSDPLADGPVIQEAALRAFNNNITLNKIFNCVKNIRINTEVPLLFLVYFNTVFSYGLEKFIEKCSKIGIDGLIIPDLPLEERDEIKPYISKSNILLIPMVTLTSNNRIKNIVSDSSGFVYCVSSYGVTGARQNFDESIENFIEDIRKETDLPIAVGFGISNNESVKYFNRFADGVIVGSAIVKVIGDTNGDCSKVRQFVKELLS